MTDLTIVEHDSAAWLVIAIFLAVLFMGMFGSLLFPKTMRVRMLVFFPFLVVLFISVWITSDNMNAARMVLSNKNDVAVQEWVSDNYGLNLTAAQASDLWLPLWHDGAHIDPVIVSVDGESTKVTLEVTDKGYELFSTEALPLVRG